MSATKLQLCRLCLKLPKNDFIKVDDTINQIMDVLLLKLDMNITKDAIVCQDCVEVAEKCLEFKSRCINTEKVILFFSIDREKTQHTIKDIHKQNENLESTANEDLDVCRFCMAQLKKNNFVSLNSLETEPIFKMITIYMPEMDLEIIKDPIVCTTCIGNVEGYFKFVLNCLDTEEKIKEYHKGNASMGHVKLDKLQVSFKDILEYPKECPQPCSIREESNMFEDAECADPKIYSELVNLQELDIKEENKSEEFKYDTCKAYDKRGECDTESLKPRRHDIEKYTYTIGLENNLHGTLVHEDVLQVKGNKRNKLSEYGKHDNMRILVIPRGITELDNNMSVHEDVKMYKCLSCAYQTKYKSNLKMHKLVHKDVSEMETYKCPSCSYEAKHKSSLQKHKLIHMNVPEIEMYKCALCAFESRHKRSLTIHMSIHKDVSKIKMYKCPHCVYEAKHKDSLKKHMLVHKDVSEIQMYKCALCAYESRYKRNLKIHMLVHKDLSDIQMYKCALCAFESKYKGCLTSHMFVHKDVSEVEMCKCPFCPYEAKQKRSLKRHMLVHKDVSEIEIYKCVLCAYESKYKRCLTSHMLVHKDVSEIEMYKCSLCAYRSKHRSSLKRHLLLHKVVPKIEVCKK